MLVFQTQAAFFNKIKRLSWNTQKYV